MAPKKKPEGEAGEVDLFADFQEIYKKKQKQYDTKKFDEALANIQRIIDEGEDEAAQRTPWCFSQPFDPMAFRALFEALRLSGYGKMKAIRLWKCNGGDEAVRTLCYFLDTAPPPDVEEIQLTDCGVTTLGCEFLGRTLAKGGNNVISFLRLDGNFQIGTEGVRKLSVGLSMNESLRYLSLQYCNIDEAGAQYLSHILIYIKSVLEVLTVKGNHLGTVGVQELLHGAKRAKCLSTLDVSDNHFTETPDVIQCLRDLFDQNQKIAKYDLQGNHITDAGAREIITGMVGKTHLQEVLLPSTLSAQTFEALEFQMGSGKKGGKKKK